MIYISHRGNLNGSSTEENKPEYIEAAFKEGFECEVDVRVDEDDRIWLGHDEGQYLVEYDWFKTHSRLLWIHCKNIQAMTFFVRKQFNFNYFWHENDAYTLTAHGYIWVYPGQLLVPDSICVLPEAGYRGLIKQCSAVCSDYIEHQRNTFS